MSRTALGALVLCAALVSCTSTGPDVGDPVSPASSRAPLGPLGIDVATQELVALKARAGMLDCPPSPEPDPEEPPTEVENPLPAATLPCLGGGRDVRLDQLDGPLVINFWASTCEPCRDELPILQQVHELGADQLTVLGVDFEDAKPYDALVLAAESGVTYASVADLDGLTATDMQVVALPQTVFVDGSGSIIASYRGEITSYAQAAALVLTHLGIRLPDPPVEDDAS